MVTVVYDGSDKEDVKNFNWYFIVISHVEDVNN